MNVALPAGIIIGAGCALILGRDKVLAIVRDITDLADARRKLAETRKLDEKILDGSPVAFVLYNPDMRIIRVSRAYQAVTGFDPEEVMGRKPAEFMPGGPNKRVIIENHQGEGGERQDRPCRFKLTHTGQMGEGGHSSAF